MARTNITVPDELLDRARAAGLNVSRIAASALLELDRRDKIAALDSHLQELDTTLGPIPKDELQDAQDWANRMFGGTAQPTA